MTDRHRLQRLATLGTALALLAWSAPSARGSATPEAATPDCHTAEPSTAGPPLSTAGPTGQDPPLRGWTKHSDRFPNVELLTHRDQAVRFYDDLVKDRIVIVNFMYTSCENICLPIAQNLSRVHAQLGERMGRDILILSLTIDSEVDDPSVLREHIVRNGGEKKGWLYLTGDYDDIDRVRRALGVYDLDPVIDADKSEHSGLLTFGNDRTDQWAALPALMSSEEIVETVLRITRNASNTPTRAGRGG